MLTTPVLGLKKPEDADAFGQDDFNFNSDKIDAAPGVAVQTAAQQAALTAQQKPAGRMLWVSDVAGRQKLQVYDGVNWRIIPQGSLVNYSSQGTVSEIARATRYVNVNEYTPGSETRGLANRVANLILDLIDTGIFA